ncbi:MAG: transcription termination factor Rho [Acidimicrobiia bacterium]
MSTAELDRSTLDTKDREQLHAIAGAMGVKAPTRMRKAELIEAILAAATGDAGSSGNGDHDDGSTGSSSRRTVRSARASELAASSIEALAAEEEALASADATPDDQDVAPRPARSRSSRNDDRGSPGSQDDSSGSGGSESGSDSGSSESRAAEGRDREGDGANTRTQESRSGNAPQIDAEDERSSYGDGNQNKRRRRRRGRGGEGGEPRQGQGGGANNEPQGEPVAVQGLIELRDEGYGFLRTRGYLPSAGDVYVSASQVRRFNLRKGDYLEGFSRPQASNEKYPALLRVDTVNAMSTDDARTRPRFEDLTPLFPDSQLRLALNDNPLEVTGRIIDLISPIGKGQRGLVVSPPKAGKTTILKQIVYSVERNNPEVHLMVLLVDERPEEVTDMKRHVTKGEVIASTFDRPSDEHTQVAELTIDRAKRLVELGKDVVIVLDGITRLARAYNLAAPASGRILSGGVDSTALYPPKRFFGAARNIEEGGSLTVIATALVDTGSRMDEVIFEEFKGTGNMELRLDRRIAERRIYPAIDVEASSTRHEELLFDRDELNQVWKLRRVLNALDSDGGGSSGRGLDLLLEKLKTTKSNEEFLAEVAKAPSLGT